MPKDTQRIEGESGWKARSVRLQSPGSPYPRPGLPPLLQLHLSGLALQTLCAAVNERTTFLGRRGEILAGNVFENLLDLEIQICKLHCHLKNPHFPFYA